MEDHGDVLFAGVIFRSGPWPKLVDQTSRFEGCFFGSLGARTKEKHTSFFWVGRCRCMYGYHVVSCQCHIPMFANTTFVWVVLSAIFISSLAPWICWDIQAAPCCHAVLFVCPPHPTYSWISRNVVHKSKDIQGSSYHLGMCLKLWLEVFAEGLWILWLGFPSISVSRSQEIAGAEDQSGICVGRSLWDSDACHRDRIHGAQWRDAHGLCMARGWLGTLKHANAKPPKMASKSELGSTHDFESSIWQWTGQLADLCNPL